jgi:hypothetical protein
LRILYWLLMQRSRSSFPLWSIFVSLLCLLKFFVHVSSFVPTLSDCHCKLEREISANYCASGELDVPIKSYDISQILFGLMTRQLNFNVLYRTKNLLKYILRHKYIINNTGTIRGIASVVTKYFPKDSPIENSLLVTYAKIKKLFSSKYTQELKHDILDCIEKDITHYNKLGNILLCADFNARISCEYDFILLPKISPRTLPLRILYWLQRSRSSFPLWSIFVSLLCLLSMFL